MLESAGNSSLGARLGATQNSCISTAERVARLARVGGCKTHTGDRHQTASRLLEPESFWVVAAGCAGPAQKLCHSAAHVAPCEHTARKRSACESTGARSHARACTTLDTRAHTKLVCHASCWTPCWVPSVLLRQRRSSGPLKLNKLVVCRTSNSYYYLSDTKIHSGQPSGNDGRVRQYRRYVPKCSRAWRMLQGTRDARHSHWNHRNPFSHSQVHF